MAPCCGEPTISRDSRCRFGGFRATRASGLTELLGEPTHLGSRVSPPVVLGVGAFVEGGCGIRQLSRERPVGHDERVVESAVQAHRYAAQLASRREYVVADEVLAVVEGARRAVAGGLPPVSYTHLTLPTILRV